MYNAQNKVKINCTNLNFKPAGCRGGLDVLALGDLEVPCAKNTVSVRLAFSGCNIMNTSKPIVSYNIMHSLLTV